MRFHKDMNSMPPYRPGKRLPGSIKLSSNENSLGSSPRALMALRQCTDKTHIYPPVVSEQLQAGIAEWRGVKSNQVICGNGSDEIFTLCAAATVEKGTNAVGSQHSFSQYRFATQLFGGEFRALPTCKLAYDPEAMVSALDAQTRVVFLCSPNNPTGKLIPARQLRWALERIPEDVLVVLDQAYGEYVDDPDFLDGARLISEYPHLIVTGTFSKIFGLAALRIGYGLASENIIRQLHRLKSPFNVNGLAQYVALAALSDSAFVEKSRKMTAVSKFLFYDGLKKRGMEFCKTQGNFICIRNPEGKNLAEILQKHNITVRSLESFGLPEYIRITLSTRKTTEKILNILDT